MSSDRGSPAAAASAAAGEPGRADDASGPAAEPPEPGSQPVAPSGPAPRRRGGGSARDVVLSMVVMGVVIIGYLLVSGLWQNIRIGTGRPVGPAVDVSATASARAPQASFPLLIPRGLPAGWRGTAATLRGSGLWHVGLVSPSGGFAALDQTAGPGTLILRDALPGRRASGPVSLASGRWEQFRAATTAEGLTRSGLVQQRGPTTVVVSGTADPLELRTLAASLQPVT